MNDISRLYSNFRLVDGTGAAPAGGMDMLVENGVVSRLAATGSIPPDGCAEVVRLDGKTVLPGLIDCHVHICFDPVGDPVGELAKTPDALVALKAQKRLVDLLRSGVTFFRDMGGKNHVDLALRRAVADGVIPGPSFLASGRVLAVTGGHFWPIARVADGPAEMARAAREQLAAGADVIKLMATGGVLTPNVKSDSSQMTPEEISAAVAVAHGNGVRAAVHAHGTDGIRNAVLAGVDSVEHGVYLDEETAGMMAERGTWLVPTFSTGRRMLEVGIAGGVPPFAHEKAKIAGESHLRSFHLALRAGVGIVCGTDSGTPFNPCGCTPREVLHLHGEGMSMLAAIRAATLDAARLLGVADRRGSLAEGKIADFLVFDDNPVEQPRALVEDKEVYLAGERFF